MSTPEGEVKKLVKKELEKRKIYPASKAGAFPPDACGWYFMPSQNGFGVQGIPDFIGHFFNRFFAVETKAPKKQPTGLQAAQIKAIKGSGGLVLVVDDEESLERFLTMLNAIEYYE